MTDEQIAAYIKRGKATEEVTAANPFNAFPIETITPVRLWRSVPHTNIEDSKVIGLVWDETNTLHGLCGDKNRYCFTIKNKRIDTFIPFEEATALYKTWLLSNILPQPLAIDGTISQPGTDDKTTSQSGTLDDTLVLPHAAGRQYLAKPSAVTDWNNGRKIVGTKDGLLAIINGQDVYALGNAAAYGPIRCLCTNESKTRLWGTAGDIEDLGTVFYYDDNVGLRQLGFLIYNIHGYFDGPTASNILSSIAVSKDEKLIAIGGADRIGSIHIAEI
jgi:hypothetical protein